MYRWFAYLSLLSISLCVMYVSCYSSANIRIQAGARLQCPPVVNIGDHEHGKLVTAIFQIGNSGTERLIVNEVRTGCNCTGLEIDSQGKPQRITELVVKPGENQKVMLRYTITEPAGMSQTNAVTFHTNDSENTSYRILLTVKNVLGGVSVKPQAVVFGLVEDADSSIRRVDVYEKSIYHSSVRSVESSHPSRFTAEWKSTQSEESSIEGRRLGSVIVKVNQSAAESLDGKVYVHFMDVTKQPLIIPVSGMVNKMFSIHPGDTVLPVRSDSGMLNYNHVTCRTRVENSLEVLVPRDMDGIDINVIDAESYQEKIIKVALSDARLARMASGDIIIIPIAMKAGTQEYKEVIKINKR